MAKSKAGGSQIELVIRVVRFLGRDLFALGQHRTEFRLGLFLLADIEANLGQGRPRGKAVGAGLAIALRGVILGRRTGCTGDHGGGRDQGFSLMKNELSHVPVVPGACQFAGTRLGKSR